MRNSKKSRILLALALTGTLALGGCGTAATTANGSAEQETASTQNTAAEWFSEMFTDRDLEVGYDEEAAANITLSGDGASCDSDAVTIDGSTVTITEEGTYLLYGTLDDGMILVDAEDTDKIQLVLDGVSITNADSAALYVKSADKVFVTTAADTQNTLKNGGEYIAIDDNNIDAVIFSKADLTLNGEGRLTIEAEAGHGIVSKDDLVLTSGTYSITAEKHGLSGKDSVRIADGTYTITAGKDGIHAENTENASKGFVYLEDGDFTITAEGDGVSAGSTLHIADGTYQVSAGGGSANAAVHTQAVPNMQMQTTEQSDSDNALETDSASTVSTKGFKSSSDLTVSGGAFTINCADDAFHADSNLTIDAGTLEITAGDDGLHADNALMINDGSITIADSYEGIEGLSIDIAGGDITLTASDDGLNAAGGNDGSGTTGQKDDIFAVTEGAAINISGGTLHVNAQGDGLDSNGDLTITGGETYVSSPTNGGNGSLDYNGTGSISGGILVATGSSEMAQNLDSSSTQGIIMVNVSAQSADSTIILTDRSGKELLSWQAEKEYSSVIVSCPDIVQGETYTLTTGTTINEVTMDSLVYGEGSGMGGGRRQNGSFDNGERPDGIVAERNP